MVKLRGHHLICLQFFIGKGYSSEFVKNTFKILKRAKRVIVVDGLDDVCKACPYNSAGRCTNPRTSDEKIRELDKIALSLLSVRVGSRICWDEVKRRLPKILPIWVKKACRECIWWKVCKNEMLKFKC
jgi:hypothetical protein